MKYFLYYLQIGAYLYPLYMFDFFENSKKKRKNKFLDLIKGYVLNLFIWPLYPFIRGK